MSTQFHEDFQRAGDAPGGSNRSFGLVFAAVFLLIALLPLLAGHPVRWWAVIVAVIFAGLGITAPQVLTPLNRAWIWVGRVLNRIVSPVVMALLFALAVVPTGLLLKLTGKDPLRLK